jgi:branched-chain amino acid transport system substrate-binding protein
MTRMLRAKVSSPVAGLALALVLAACTANGPSIGNTDGPLATSSVRPDSVRPDSIRPDQSPAKIEPLPDLAVAAPSFGSASADVSGPRGPVKVGLLLPLTAPGQTSLIAESMKRAAEMAVFDFESANLQLMVKDDRGTPEGARAAADEVVAGGAELVLGPLFARSVSAMLPVMRSNNMSAIAFSNDRQVAGQGVHLLGFMASAEVEAVVAHAVRSGKRRFASLVSDDAFGRGIEDAFRDAVSRNGATVVAAKSYPAQPNAMLDPVRQLRNEMNGIEEHGNPIEVLFVPGGEDTLVSLGPLLRQAEFNPQKIKIIGTGGLDYPAAGRDPMFVGAWFAAPDPKGWQAFSDKYARSYGHAPPRIASLAYDAVAAAAALASGPRQGRFAPAALARSGGFTGVDGQFRFNADGTVDRGLAILEVQKIGATVLWSPERAGLDRVGNIGVSPVVPGSGVAGQKAAGLATSAPIPSSTARTR